MELTNQVSKPDYKSEARHLVAGLQHDHGPSYLDNSYANKN